MGYGYQGPNFAILPQTLIERIREVVRVAEFETKERGTSINEIDKKHYNYIVPEQSREAYKTFSEIFTYYKGTLQQVQFNVSNRIYLLNFSGVSSSDDDMKKIEDALGLQVVKRPMDIREDVQVSFAGQPLEKIILQKQNPSAVVMGRR